MDRNNVGEQKADQVKATPLIEKPVSAPIAWLSKPQPNLPEQVSVEPFLKHVHGVAKALPDGKHAINLCDNRYLFLVVLCAVILREQTNLLPPNKNPETQKSLAERYSDAYIVHDGELSLAAGIKSLNVTGVDWSRAEFSTTVMVPINHLAAISFTSGSTGEAKPNLKTWRALRDSTRINSAYMMPSETEVYYHLATVPGQHMWGLETSVLLPLFSNACLVDARPLYPHDIVDLLKRMPTPNCLITTPLHLRALAGLKGGAGGGSLPRIDNVLVATAPLSQDLADRVEKKYSTSLREVYGCSEVGSMAVRRAAKTDIWTQFSGLNFVQNQRGSVSVSADHLPEVVVLEDTLAKVDEHSFRLEGRVSDQIKIAGKRGSLMEVNTVLMKCPGILDGVVFFPQQERAVPRLVAIVVFDDTVGDDVDKEAKAKLRAHFRHYLDSAFVPRPIFFVDALPREENGKLLKTKLISLYQNLVTAQSVRSPS